jgi:hypothetical protein
LKTPEQQASAAFLGGIDGSTSPGAPVPPSVNPAMPGCLDASLDAVDAVGAALARALEGATVAGRWDLVAQLARELEARRLTRVENVVQLTRTRR